MSTTIRKTAMVDASADAGTFTGYAATYGNIDRQGDLIQPGAFSGTMRRGSEVPILWNHDANTPGNVIGRTIGTVEDEHGLLVTARLDLDNPVAAEAYRLLRNGTVRSMSVGMLATQADSMPDGTRIIREAELLEISITPTPANPQAEIITVKSANTQEGTPMADTTENTTATENTATVHTDAAKNYQEETKVPHVENKVPAVETKTADADMTAAAKAFTGTGATTGTSYLDLKSIAAIAPRLALDYSNRLGTTKGLVAEGSTAFQIPLVNTNPIAADLGSESRPRLVSVIPTVTRTAPVYDALQETTPDDKGGAAVVAPGTQKPVTKLSLRRIEQRLRVIATLSEPIDKYALRDIANIQQWIGTRLTDSVTDALENEIINGDGTGEHILGLAHTQGVQEYNATNTNPLDSIIAAIAKLESINVNAQYIAMNPADWLELQRFKDANGQYYVSSVIDGTNRKVFGTRIVTTAALATGTAYIIGTDAITLSTDGRLDIEWNPYANFATNQTVARAEGRFQLDCLRPQRIVRTTLTKQPATN